MTPRKALYRALLAIYPVLFAIVLIAAIYDGVYPKTVIAVPFLAAILTLGFYLPALLAGPPIWAMLKSNERTDPISICLASVVVAEVVFWAMVRPYWDDSGANGWMQAIVIALCALAFGFRFWWLAVRPGLQEEKTAE